MCGITGFFISKNTKSCPDLPSSLQSMTKTLQHRGPDDSGCWIGQGIGLGHRRLSILDLSSAGHQPMATEDYRIQIVFNGEIYNFNDLRAELAPLGYRFRGHSDTEVLLYGYHQWGTKVFERLRGMFAIAIWDGNQDQLILTRDRIGKKPLFYAWHHGILLFGSEIKAILAWPGFQREPALEAIHHYLSHQYIPAPWSAFNGIQKVPQACYLTITREGQCKTHRYWELPNPRLARARPIAELCEELSSFLDESVRLRMVSDVPIGAFLSGGVDSSAVVAMMARNSSSKVKTFCIGFDEAEYDERHYARIVAKQYATDHHEMVVRPNALEVLPSLVWHYNEPFADPSAVPTYYVSQIARQHVTVVLNGDGGDENFLGYSRYLTCLKSQWVRNIPQPLRSFASVLLGSMPQEADRYRILRGIRKCLALINEKDTHRYAPTMLYFFEQDKRAGYDERLRPFLPQSSVDLLEPYFKESPSFVGGAGWADIHTYLPDDLLVKVDIASMAHGLEARSPFLDQQLMAWAASIPASQKINKNNTLKFLLKKAMEPYLPKEILNRPKMGFGVPINHWFKNEIKDFAYDTLLSLQARKRGLIKTTFVETMLNEHCAGIREHHTRLWALLMLELWFQMWIDPPQPSQKQPSKFSIL